MKTASQRRHRRKPAGNGVVRIKHVLRGPGDPRLTRDGGDDRWSPTNGQRLDQAPDESPAKRRFVDEVLSMSCRVGSAWNTRTPSKSSGLSENSVAVLLGRHGVTELDGGESPEDLERRQHLSPALAGAYPCTIKHRRE